MPSRYRRRGRMRSGAAKPRDAGKRNWRNTMSVSTTKAAMRLIIGGLGLFAGIALASAENAPAPAPNAPATEQSGASSADDVKQIKLTDDQVTHFIAAQADLAAIASKIQAAGDKPDP